MDYKRLIADCGQPEYDRDFQNYVRGDRLAEKNLVKGFQAETTAYAMPSGLDSSYEKAVSRESIMRQLATVVNQYNVS